MNARHMTRRPLRKQHGFSWCRIPSEQLRPLQYRLFIRDSAGVSHGELRAFSREELARGPRYVAGIVRAMRAQLRWRVEKLEFERLGLVDTTPQPEAFA